MTAHPPIATGLSGAVTFLSGHPFQVILLLLPLGVGVMLGVDALLAERAEYFNAWYLVDAWHAVLTGTPIPDAQAFIVGQESLGNPLALGLGTILLFAEPAVVLAIIVVPASLILRSF